MKAKRLVPLVILLTAGLLAQTTPSGTTKSKPKKKAAAAPSATAELAAQMQVMRQMLDQQQQQIQQLQQQVQSRDQQLLQLQSAANEARSRADAAASSSSQTAEQVSALQSTVKDVNLNTANLAATVQDEQKRVGEMVESPLAIHYKGVTITPGGFLVAESVYRQHGLGADVNTPFNNIPFSGSTGAHISEWFGSGRQSRITLLVEGKIKNATLRGYYETDWLGAGISSNNNQSNSYVNRQRQLYAQAALNNGWTFTGGQMWSLVTETKKGLDNRTEATPLTIDAQYVPGFSWARQFGFRVTKNFNNKFWLGASVENAQTLNLGGGGFINSIVLGAPGTGGGLYNGGLTIGPTGSTSPAANYSFNYTPDFVVKAAFEPGFGHYEVFGIISNFRDRIYPNTPSPVPPATSAAGVAAVGAFNDNRTGGGGGANARWSVLQKHVDIGIHALVGDGVGRYGNTTLPEITLRPNGTIAPIRSYQALGTLEWHSPHWDIYGNGGGEYAARTVYASGSPLVLGSVGYGRFSTNSNHCTQEFTPTNPAPSGTSTGFTATNNGCPDTRNIIEGTFGFWYKPYAGPKGRIQFGPQYAYVVRNSWRDKAGTFQATEHMFFTSFRYYLP